MAITPINNSRISPPVDRVGDTQLERSRREFLDLIKSDERRHNGDSRRGNREQQSHAQQSAGLEAGRLAQAAGDQARSRPALVAASSTTPAGTTPANARMPGAPRPDANPASRAPDFDSVPSAGFAGRSLGMSPTARALLQEQIAPVARRDPQARDNDSNRLLSPQTPSGFAPDAQATRRVGGAASPGRHPSPIGAPPPPEARPRWPAPPPGSSLVAPASEARSLNLVADAPTAAPAFRLSSEVPREVADRIAHFMRTGSLDRNPFSFGQITPVADQAERMLTPEEAADHAVASLLAEAAPHMRLQTGKDAAGNLVTRTLANGNFTTASLGMPALPETPLPGHLAAQAAIQAQAGLQPQMFVVPATARKPALVPEQPRSAGPASNASPGHVNQASHGHIQNGDVNPLFAPAPFGAGDGDESDDDFVIDLIAGPRWDARRDRIA